MRRSFPANLASWLLMLMAAVVVSASVAPTATAQPGPTVFPIGVSQQPAYHR